MVALSKEFYKQLNSIENFKQLDYNDPQVVAIRLRADQELEAMENSRIKPTTKIKYKKTIYEFYDKGEVVAVGTADELAEQTGFKANTITKLGTPKYLQTIDRMWDKHAVKIGKKYE